MESILKTLRKEPLEYTGIALMGIFIASNMKVPSDIGNMIDTLMGRLIVITLALSLFFVHHILGGVALIFAYELIRRSERKGYYQARQFLPSEIKKGVNFNALNQFPPTLEEEMVEKLVPISRKNLGEPEFRPIMSKLHDATKI
jgi:surfactin synthase thioesterase subunit